MQSPSGKSAGISFREWTAQSIRPSSKASSISFVNMPLPPISRRRRSCTRSPVVVMTINGGGGLHRGRIVGISPERSGDPALHMAGLGEAELGTPGADPDWRLLRHGRRVTSERNA